MLPLALRLRSSLARPSTSSSTSLLPIRLPSSSVRAVSSTLVREAKLPAHKKKRIVPQRKIFIKQKPPRQKSDEELEDEDIARQLREQAGHNLKSTLKGVKVQQRYFKDALRRQDKEILTAETLEGLPELTDAQIDDFYINLMASGTTLGNLPSVPSPTHKAAPKPPHAGRVTEAEFELLPRETKEQVVAERLRILHAIDMRTERRKDLFAAVGVPREMLERPATPEDDRPAQLASLDEVIDEFETVGVRAGEVQSARAAALEFDENGLARPVANDATSSSPVETSGKGPDWAGTPQGLRSALPPRQPAAGGPSSAPTTSQASASSLTAVALLQLLDAPKPYHDPQLTSLARERTERTNDPSSAAHIRLQGVLAAPSSSLALLDTTKDTVSAVLASEPREGDVEGEVLSASARRRSTLDLGLLTSPEWRELITSFTTTDVEPVHQTPSVQRMIEELEDRRQKRADAKRYKRQLPLRNIEKGRMGLLRERGDLALEALETCWRSGASIDGSLVHSIGKILVEGGHVEGVDRLHELLTEAKWDLTPGLHALKVEAHLTLHDLRSAISTLHAMEDKSITLPESTYHAVIRPLVHAPAPSHRATGWNLFGHMRLVAHPTPTLALYTEMIRACAHPTHPEPERALDLWTEMTIDASILPDVAAFNAIMLACGQVQRFYPEAFRLMRQLLDFYRTSPVGTPQKAMYTPNRATFEALLDGAKRNGDIARARWVLTEMIRFSNHPGLADDGAEIGPTTSTLASVLQTYASTRPKISNKMLKVSAGSEKVVDRVAAPKKDEDDTERGLDHAQMTDQMRTLGFVQGEGEDAAGNVVVEGSPATQVESANARSAANEGASNSASTPLDEPIPPRNVATSPLPQSAAEILQEASLLLQHARHDGPSYTSGARSPSGGLPPLRFVKCSTHLVNSYLGVRYQHDTLANSIEAFKTAFVEAAVPRNGHSWRFFLECLSRADKADREVAAREAFELFREWEQLEADVKARFEFLCQAESLEVANAYYTNVGYTPDTIRRIFAAMIKIMSYADQLDLAKSLVQRFVELYPPSDILASLPEPLPSKALVTLVPRVAVRPDPLPPHLLFADLAPLHERYVVYQQGKGIAYIKFVVSEYARYLQRYREARLSQGPDGERRAKENEYARAAAKEFREFMGPDMPVRRHLKSRFRTLEDFEGVMGDIPDGKGKSNKDLRRKRVLGDKAVGVYHRALKQRW